MKPIQVQSFNHVAIWVTDMRKSATWYTELLGMEVKSETDDHIFLKLGSGEVLALFQASDPARVGSGVHHIALTLSPGEKEKALETLRQRNIPRVQRGPGLNFQDPDGYWIHFS